MNAVEAYLVWYNSSQGPRFSSMLSWTWTAAKREEDRFIEDGYQTAILKVVVNADGIHTSWIDRSPYMGVDPAKVQPGLYRIWWRNLDGGTGDIDGTDCTVAAVGIADDGERWIASTNWVGGTSTKHWADVVRIEPIAAS